MSTLQLNEATKEDCHVCSGGDNCSSGRCSVTQDRTAPVAGCGKTDGNGGDPVACSFCKGSSPVLEASPDNCSGTTNCQTGDDVACTVVGGRRITVEGQCAGQRSRAVSEAELFLVDKSIQDYQFEQVRYRLENQKLIEAGQIETAIEEYKKFLTVIAHAEGPVGMISPVVDEVWHAFILHTPDYVGFCEDVFGEFLHHQPNTPNSPSSPDAVINFVSGYEALFGALNPIWTQHLVHECCQSGETCVSDGSSGDCHAASGK